MPAAVGDIFLPDGRKTRTAVVLLFGLSTHSARLLANGEVTYMAELARLGHVSRARITQIMNLRLLAPDIQEDLLFLPRTDATRDPLKYADIRPLTVEPDWAEQRRQWAGLR